MRKSQNYICLKAVLKILLGYNICIRIFLLNLKGPYFTVKFFYKTPEYTKSIALLPEYDQLKLLEFS